ncbi:AAA family ATPase [Streptomyces sp. NPDC056479]|uniref:AAA family ATPase n=1 Tax=Streptomyces sp. NPDC056479 TaxID=3345832 RepID=UPI0036A8841A
MSEDPTSMSRLDEWLHTRREGDPPEHRSLDLNRLLPQDSGFEAIRAELARFIHGQEERLRQISVLLSMHLQWAKNPDPLHPPPNAVVIGPTGSGKTFTMQVAARFLRIPFVTVDATSLVPAGIVGLQVEDVLQDLVNLADAILDESDVPRTKEDSLRLAERGVILFDEFDKINYNSPDQGDAGLNLGVQRRLLKLCEGAPVSVGVRSHSDFVPKQSTVNTAGILILASGAFSDIGRTLAMRPAQLSLEHGPDEVLPEDLANYGFVKELVARFPALIQYSELSADDLVKILRNENISPLTVWRNYVRSLGTELSISRDAESHFAQKASELGLGARGLQQVLFPRISKLIADRLTSDGEGDIQVTAADL